MDKTVKCPTCAKKLIWSPKEKWRPFCCERCKLIDLGEWASENHRIKGEPHFSSDNYQEDDTT